MKKIFGLLALFLILSSCDDGDMTFQSFNFDGDPVACSTTDNVYLKINGNEVLLLDLSSHPLTNVPSLTDTNGDPVPETFTLSLGTIKYRNYQNNSSSTSVPANSVCTNIDNADISVLEEWQGSGSISVITTKLETDANEPQQYVHSITLVDVSFTKGDETIRIENNFFGEIDSNTDINFAFNDAAGDILDCTDNLYKLSGSESLQLFFASGVINNTVDTTDVPLNSSNFLVYKDFTSTVSVTSICGNNPPASPTVEKNWQTETEGTVRIVTTAETVGGVTVYNHDIYLVDVRFYNMFSAGEYFIPTATETDGSYYVGTYVTQ